MLISFATVQAFLTDILDAQEDQVTLLIQWIQQKAEVICKRSIEQAARTITLDGNGSDTLILPHWPVASVASLTVDDLEVTVYDLDEARGMLYLDNGDVFASGRRNVEIAYTAGWSDTTIPADVKLAFMEAISWNLQRVNNKSFGVKNQTSPNGVSVGYELVLPLSVQRVFESYRSVGI